MNIGGSAPIQAPIAPAPEQVADSKKIETKPFADGGAAAVDSSAPKEAASKPSNPGEVGKLHAIA